jgi:hypothetical protein
MHLLIKSGEDQVVLVKRERELLIQHRAPQQVTMHLSIRHRTLGFPAGERETGMLE